jgi:putative peptide zinc metalloprotease protein
MASRSADPKGAVSAEPAPAGPAAVGPTPVGPAPAGPAPAGPAPVGPTANPRLGPSSRVELRELHISREGDDFLLGDVTRGEFIAVPAVAVAVIAALRAGDTLADTAERVRAETGEQVDVEDFVATLIGLGFVARVDGAPLVGPGGELAYGGRLGEAIARLARPFYTWTAFALYGVLFIGCLAVLISVPQLRPHITQLFFLPNPILSAALLTVIGMPLAMTHELAHWVGARVNGVPARITVSRRYYMMVLQTDLTALWALARRRRFAALLAGIAWDTVRLSALLAARAAQLAGWWHPAPLLGRLIAALIVTHVLTISWQFFVFLRTDIYAVLATGLGCLNLTRISKLRMARLYRRLTSAEAAELADAGPRDIMAARWYGWIQAGGLVLVVIYFFVFFVPLIITIARWIILGLARNSPASFSFWEVLASGSVALIPAAVPAVTYVRDRRRRPRRRRAHRRRAHRRRPGAHCGSMASRPADRPGPKRSAR